MSSSENASFSPSDEETLLESGSRRIVLLESLASHILPKLVPITISTSSVLTTTTTVTTNSFLPTESGTSKPRSQQPVESSPRRIVLLKALSDLVKSEQSPAVVDKSPTKKHNTKSPVLSGVTALPKLGLLPNAKSSESSPALLGQTTSSFTKITKGASRPGVVEVSPMVSNSNQRTGKSLPRRIVLLKSLSEELITPEGRKDIIHKKLKALHKPGSVSKKVSSSKSIEEDAPSTNTPRRPIKPTPTVLPNLMPKAFKIHPAVPNMP